MWHKSNRLGPILINFPLAIILTRDVTHACETWLTDDSRTWDMTHSDRLSPMVIDVPPRIIDFVRHVTVRGRKAVACYTLSLYTCIYMYKYIYTHDNMSDVCERQIGSGLIPPLYICIYTYIKWLIHAWLHVWYVWEKRRSVTHSAPAYICMCIYV